MALGRQLLLILSGMSIAGICFLGLRCITRSTVSFNHPPLIYPESAIASTSFASNVSRDYISVEEHQEIRKCIDDFPKLRFDSKVINKPLMEVTRVNSHSFLNSNSRVLEVGGYTGEDAAKLIRIYNPFYIAMEPIPRFQRILRERFKQNPKFKVLGIGLGKENKTLYLNIDSDATSLFRKKEKSASTTQEVAYIRNMTEVFEELRVKENPVDLITINCEGCEFELLEELTKSNLVKCFRNIQFQFHLDLPGIADQEKRYCTIMTLLSRTHRPTFQFAYTWQSWRMKE